MPARGPKKPRYKLDAIQPVRDPEKLRPFLLAPSGHLYDEDGLEYGPLRLVLVYVDPDDVIAVED